MARSKPRWYRLTPDRLILGLLAVEGLLWLTERPGWPAWHKGYAVMVTVAVVGVAFLLLSLWFAIALVFRWRFQFTLRSLLIVVVVVAVPCSWLAAEMNRAKVQQAAVEGIRNLGGGVTYDWEADANRNPLPNAQPPGPRYVRDLLGYDLFAEPVSADINIPVQRIGPSPYKTLGMEHLPRLPQLQCLSSTT
jgi:hypothetical protein